MPPCMISLRKTTRDTSAMTLTELLLAIVVIALLITLAIPTLGKIRERSQLVGCLSHLKQLGSASLNYAVDHQGYLPRGDQPQANGAGYIQWPYVLDGYFGVYYLDLLANPTAFRASPFSCPEEKETFSYHYALNRQLNERLVGDKAYIRLSQVRNPSRYVLFSDAYFDRTIFSDLRDKMISMTRMTRRHGGFPNFVYADGHVASYRGPLYGVSDAEGRNNPDIRAMWEFDYQIP